MCTDRSLVQAILTFFCDFISFVLGDMVPTTYASRIFTCFFALSGVACLGIAIGVIGTNVMEAEEAAVERTKKLAQSRVLGLFQSSSSSSSSADMVVEAETAAMGKKEKMDDKDEPPPKMHPLLQLLFHFMLVMVILVIFAFAVANDPGIDVKWDIFDALYYTIITASTVGYGTTVQSFDVKCCFQMIKNSFSNLSLSFS